MKAERTDRSGLPWSILRQERYHHSTASVMIRELDGSIYFWNRAAERHYGWSRRHAVGNVSHKLLETVFPCPLNQINQQLLEDGVWEGELLHTLSDGSRVKVHSHWELRTDTEPNRPAVIEINSAIKKVEPATAFLSLRPKRGERLVKLLVAHKRYWLTPIVGALLAVGLLSKFASEIMLIPLFD